MNDNMTGAVSPLNSPPGTVITGAPWALSAEADPSVAASLPQKILILKWGENENSHGRKVVVDEKLAEALSSEAYPFRTVALDFEHNTCPGTPEYNRTEEPRSVAAFGDITVEPGKGVFLSISRWTPAGLAHALEYEDVSAAPICDKDGFVVAIPSVALCRTGAVPGITFSETTLSASAGIPPAEKQTENQSMDYRKKIIELLGLADDASDEDIHQAMVALKDAAAQKAKADAETQQEQQALSATVQALSARVDAAEKREIIAAARLCGKVIALSEGALAKMTVEDVQKVCAETAATVPLAAKTPEVVPETPSAALSVEREKIARMCGVKPEVLA